MFKPVCAVIFCVFFCFSAFSQNVRSTADTSQEAALIQQYHTRVRYENDGTGATEVTAAIRIQSQAGIDEYGQLRFGYSSATEKLEINYVRVRKPGGQVVDTPAANAQDFAPEVLRSAPMYSDFRERHITVAALRPGDVLEYRTTTATTIPLAAGEFWFEHRFPKYEAVAQARLDIDVPKSREVKLKSPRRKYTTAEAGDRRTYSWLVENIVPDRKEKDGTDDTPDNADDDSPDVQLTTFKDWQQVARWYAALQGERVVVDDALQKKAAELTKGSSTQQEKAERLYDYVAKDIRYVSLSFGVGRYQPHAAPEVMQGLYGDCKDKHTLLSALLRAAGIQSYPVLIDSSRKLDEEIPSPAQFDHVITIASIDKNWVWLDATSEVAPYALLLYPLRDKQAVVASADANGGLRRTPAAVPGKNGLWFSIDGKVSETGALESTVNVSTSGDAAVFMRMSFRSTSQADWKKLAEVYARTEGLKGQVSEVDVKELENTAKPFVLTYKYHDDTYFSLPSTGATYFPLSPLQLPRLRKPRPTEQLDLGPMIELHDKAHLQFAPNYALRLPPEVRLSRDYADYSLSYKFANGVLDAERNVVFKTSKLPASRRSDVQSLRSVVMSYPEQSISADVRLMAKGAMATTSTGMETPQELRKAGTRALQQRDFRTATDMFKRLAEKEPKSKDAWDSLGRAYAGLSNHTEAISAYRKQVEADPFNDRAYRDLGAELRQQGKLEEALDAYGKQLANVPVDRVARKYHALLLVSLKRNKEALTELETANTASPDDPEIELALAQLYSANGNQEKSRALMKSVIGGPNAAPGADLFAIALGDDINPDDTQADAKNIVDTIDEQFDSKAFEDGSPEATSVMYFLALEWARIGWAKCLKGERLEGLRFLDSAWHLDQSAALANRLSQLYQKAGDTVKARHFSLLSLAAGAKEVEVSHSGMNKPATPAEATQAKAELLEMRTTRIPGLAMKKGQADFILVFSGSSRPERVEFAEGDPDLQPAEQALMDATYKVLFPDYSSLKIVRRGVLTCTAMGCAMVLNPIQNVTWGLTPSQSAEK